LDNGAVKCWGTNTNGQLGLGDTSNRGDQSGEMGDALPAVALGTGVTATAISAGFNFACAIVGGGSVPAGSVKCWGANSDGQLGLGDVNARGDGANEMGDSLPVVNIGTGRTAKMIATGHNFACVIRDNDTVACWGANSSHQLGRDAASVTAPNDKIGDASSEMGNSLVAVNLGQGVAQLAIGGTHACALLVDAVSVKCWGSNWAGQLGQGDTTTRGSSTAPMSGVAAIDLGLTGGATVSVVAAGNAHNCVYTSAAQVKCWGDNGRGQLGIGQATTVKIGDASGEMGVNLPIVDYAATSPTEVRNISSTSTATSVTLSWDPPLHPSGTITAYEATCGSRGSLSSTWNGTNSGWTSLGLQQTVTVTSTMYGNVASEGLIECFIRARTIAGTTGEGLTMRAGRRAGIPLAVTASSHTVTVGATAPTITGSPSINRDARTSETS
jgi:alpha-tubulin suppressor-like RCC1 family protein